MNTNKDINTRPLLSTLIRQNRKDLYMAWITLVLAISGVVFELTLPLVLAAVVTYIGFPDFLIRMLTALSAWRGGEKNIFQDALDTIEGSSFIYGFAWLIGFPSAPMVVSVLAREAGFDLRMFGYTLVIMGLILLPLALRFVMAKMRTIKV